MRTLREYLKTNHVAHCKSHGWLDIDEIEDKKFCKYCKRGL